jgi:hypothetical protein
VQLTQTNDFDFEKLRITQKYDDKINVTAYVLDLKSITISGGFRK